MAPSQNTPVSILKNPRFRKWFGNSLVADSHGNPIAVYHGSNRGGFSSFAQRKPGTTGGSWQKNRKIWYFTTNPTVASDFAMRGNLRGPLSKVKKASIYKVFLCLTHPLVIDAKEDYWGAFHQKIMDAYDSGKYDGAIIVDTLDFYSAVDVVSDVVAVFDDPSRIKSAIGNRGTYSRTSNNMNENYFREATEKVPLKQWNQAQKSLWMALVKSHMVDKNDTETFRHFATYFDRYYHIHGKFPRFHNIVMAMGGYA
jgi:hypothetical protein